MHWWWNECSLLKIGSLGRPQVIDHIVHIQARQMAAVLLRRLLSSAFDEVYPTLPSDVQTAIKSELLMIIQMETQSSMRKKICDIAAELARNLIGVYANTFIIML